MVMPPRIPPTPPQAPEVGDPALPGPPNPGPDPAMGPLSPSPIPPGLPPGGTGPLPEPPMTEPAPAAAPLPPEPVLPPEEVDDLKPIYPAWLMDRNPRSETFGEVKPPKKPTPEFCRDAIATDERRHQSLIDRFRDDLRTYRLMDESMFEDLDPNDVELYTSAEPAFQVEKLANMVSGIDHIIQFPSKTQEEETDAQTLENFAYHFLAEIDTHHRAGGNAAYKWDLAFYRAVYGRMITRVLPDPTDPDFPWDVRMYDPATVFPVFGTKRGLVRVS